MKQQNVRRALRFFAGVACVLATVFVSVRLSPGHPPHRELRARIGAREAVTLPRPSSRAALDRARRRVAKGATACAVRWLVDPVIAGASVDAITALSSRDVWAVGAPHSGPGPLIAHWNGTRWSRATAPLFGPGGELRLLSASAANNVWTLGIRSRAGGPLAERWDGRRWRTVPTLQVDEFSSFRAVAATPDDIWVAGARGNDAYTMPLVERYRRKPCRSPDRIARP